MTETLPYTETEERIFEAALQAFSRKGKDGARMQEIADKAGINKAMLHYYFRSKDKLYESVLSYVFGRFMRSFAEVLQETESFADTLRTFINGFIDFGRENIHVIRLMVSENMCGATGLTEHLKNNKAKNKHFPSRLFLERMMVAIDKGEIRAVDPHQTLLTTISSCQFFLVMLPTVQVMNPAAKDLDAFVEARKEHLFDLLYHGLEPTA